MVMKVSVEPGLLEAGARRGEGRQHERDKSRETVTNRDERE
jgi:hypothetical protein